MRVRREDDGGKRAQMTLVYKNVHLCTASDTCMLLCVRSLVQAHLYQWRVWSERNIYCIAWCHVFTLSTLNLWHWRQSFYIVEIFISSKLDWFLNPVSYNSNWNACWGRENDGGWQSLLVFSLMYLLSWLLVLEVSLLFRHSPSIHTRVNLSAATSPTFTFTMLWNFNAEWQIGNRNSRAFLPREELADEVLEAPQITTVVYCEKLIGLYVLLTGSSGLIY